MCPGCSMPNFTLLGLSCSPPSYKWSKYGPLWPTHGPNMVLKIGSSEILINMPRDVPCKILHCWVYPVAPFPWNGQNMVLLWPKHGPQMVLQIDYSWILINIKIFTCPSGETFWSIQRIYQGNFGKIRKIDTPDKRTIFWPFQGKRATR